MSQSVQEHRDEAKVYENLRVGVVTVSDTRTWQTDQSGDLLVSLLVTAGHAVIRREIIPDDAQTMSWLLGNWRDMDDLDAVLLTGGTGVSPRDVTYETVNALLTKPLPGFGELFRMLSYAEIGPACLLSRAVGGLINRLVVLAMPGSRAAVSLAMEKIILPELPHLVREARKS